MILKGLLSKSLGEQSTVEVKNDRNCSRRNIQVCNRIEILVITYGTQAWKLTPNNDRTLEIAEKVFLEILPEFTQNVKKRVEIVKRNCVDLGPLI